MPSLAATSARRTSPTAPSSTAPSPTAGVRPERFRLALPKGRMKDGVFALLGDAGVRVRTGARGYRPTVSLPATEAKLLKPQNIVEMLDLGSRDAGFAGADWVAELGADLVEVLDLGLDPVKVVAAAPTALLRPGVGADRLPRGRRLVVASEYARLTERWITQRGLDARVVRTYGATEVFPPEDADLIVDNTATGATLAANGLEVLDTVMTSSTRLYASRAAMDDPARRARVEDLALVLRSVLDARARVMVEVNVSVEAFDRVLAILPCMREPTVARLHGESGFAVKAAVPRRALPVLVPDIKAAGGTDIVVMAIGQLVP